VEANWGYLAEEEERIRVGSLAWFKKSEGKRRQMPRK
jgi:hypothetical protein